MGFAILPHDGKCGPLGLLPIAVHECCPVSIIGHARAGPSLTAILDLDGECLDVRVVAVARLCTCILGDGVAEGLPDVCRCVVERLEHDVAVSVVRLYVKFVAPLVPQAERELPILELTALQSCRGPQLDRPRCLAGHEDICPLGLLGYPVYGG